MELPHVVQLGKHDASEEKVLSLFQLLEKAREVPVNHAVVNHYGLSQQSLGFLIWKV